MCLAQTRDAKASPRYVSFEMDHSSVEAAEIGFSLLREMGYRRFKIINQARNGLLECPNPPREGRYILRRFDTLSSGLFGEETPGTWLNSDEVQTQVRHIVALKKWLDSDGLLATNLPNWAWNIVKSHSRGWPSAWYDVHATM